MNPQDDLVQASDELASLKARADMLGIAYHPSIKVEKLREKVNTAMTTPTAKELELDAAAQEAAEQQKHIDEASKLVRIVAVCMNPNKKEWVGEIYTVSNSVVGTFKKYVPFNVDEGWHVPNIIYQHLVQRECQVFYTVKDARGNSVRKGKLIKEFAINVLPPLTSEELRDLAQKQAMSHAID